jgi:Mycotoxin biosynthesis protein UstYa
LDTHPPTIYRQDPSPAVDAAWDRIANVRTTVISRDDVVKLGKDPVSSAKYPPSFGYGDDAYVAEVDVFHLIHCLDSLRREIFFDHYHADKFPDGKPSDLHKQHTSHCIYILLQNLMCSASVDVITHKWFDVQKHPFPDFNIQKKCRNFDDILAWQEKHVVDDAPYSRLRRPADMEPVKTSDEFKDLFYQWNYKHNDDSYVD